MFFEPHQKSIQQIRLFFNTLITPILFLADLPYEMLEWGDRRVKTKGELIAENEELKDKITILQGQLAKFTSFRAENARLRALLGSKRKGLGKRLVAEILSVANSPQSRQVIINKGLKDDVFVGQAIIDATGIMGQIVDVSTFTSRALLITDSKHAIPVRIARNGFRAIATGKGELNKISLENIPTNEDVKTGDILLSSGLGQRFPDGYPVAQVMRVEYKPGDEYAEIEAVVLADLDRSNQILLVWPDTIPKQENTLLADQNNQ